MSFTLLCITHTLIITEIEVFLLQTPGSLKNARHKWGKNQLGSSGNHLACAEADAEGMKGGPKKSNHTKSSLCNPTNTSPNNFSWAQTSRSGKCDCLGRALLGKLTSCKMGQKSVRICLVQMLPLFTHLKQTNKNGAKF